MRPRDLAPAACGSRRMIDSAVTLLPQPDSPTMPSVSPRVHARRRRRRRRVRRAVVGAELRRADRRPRERRSPQSIRRHWPSCQRGDLGLDHRAVEDAGRACPASPRIREMHEALAADSLEARSSASGSAWSSTRRSSAGYSSVVIDLERRRLLAALVAAGRFARLQRGDQALARTAAPCGRVGTRGLGEHRPPASMLPATEKPSWTGGRTSRCRPRRCARRCGRPRPARAAGVRRAPGRTR